MVDERKKLLDGRFKSDGYDVGGTAGQTVRHCHIHLITHRTGDSVNKLHGLSEFWHEPEISSKVSILRPTDGISSLPRTR